MLLLLAAALLLRAVPAEAHHPFGPRAGFDKARYGVGWWSPRERQSIKVWKPDAWGLRLNAALNDWNDAAGWDLFDRVFNRDNADVVFKDDGTGTYTVCLKPDGGFDVSAAYGSCTIHMSFHDDSDYYLGVAEHELAHVLGFPDHVHASQYQSFLNNDLNPRVCDDPNHPAYSAYGGVVSYCQSSPNDVVAADAKMLYRHEYRDTAP